MLTAEKQWIDYGKPDAHGYGYIAYSIRYKLFIRITCRFSSRLKNADSRATTLLTVRLRKILCRRHDSLKVGEGKIGNSESYACAYMQQAHDGVETAADISLTTKTFTAGKDNFLR